MAGDLQLSTTPITAYELECIRMERVLDGWRGESADAPLGTGSSMDKRNGGPEENKRAESSVRRRRPLD